MIRYILLFSLLLVSAAASAQAQMDEVVYLKDGSSVRGLIIEWVPGSSISIKDKSGEMHKFVMADVDRIRREAPLKAPPTPFYAAIEAGLTDFPLLAHYTHYPMASVSVIGGTRASKIVYTGLGFGADIYSTHLYYLSAFAHLRILLTKKKIAPYVELNAGYTGIIFNEYTNMYYLIANGKQLQANGFMANTSVGVKFSVARKIALTLSAGYKMVGFPGDAQNSRYYYSDNNGNFGHGATVRAGIAF